MRSITHAMARMAMAALAASALSVAAFAESLADVKPLLADPAKGKDALQMLAKLPLAECQTIDYQLAVAKAARNAGSASQVAEAVETANFLPAPGAAGASELASHRLWLEDKGKELYQKAIDAKAKGDLKTAVKSYLVAVKCNQAMLGRDDQGLGATALGALKKMVDKHPDKPEMRFQLGFYSYLFGDLPAATAAMQAHGGVQHDPYLQWRGQLWAKSLSAEQSRVAAAAAQSAAHSRRPVRLASSAARADTLPDPEAASDTGHDKGGGADQFRKEEAQRHIAEIDEQLAELKQGKKGEVVMVNGQQMLRSYNQKAIKQRIADLEAKKAELESGL